MRLNSNYFKCISDYNSCNDWIIEFKFERAFLHLTSTEEFSLFLIWVITDIMLFNLWFLDPEDENIATFHQQWNKKMRITIWPKKDSIKSPEIVLLLLALHSPQK